MPDHVHAIVWFPIPGQLSLFMQPWKRLISHDIGLLVRSKFVRYAEKIGPDDPFGQARYYSFNLSSEERVREKLTSLHENPVRAGLVAHPCDWASIDVCLENDPVSQPLRPIFRPPVGRPRFIRCANVNSSPPCYEQGRSVGLSIRWIG